tara:strand:- start:1585 stop:2355 length:771 start_codon:yes stop_codon:yes gene_type:complete
MKQNEIALTLYTVRDFCQTEKDLLNTLNKIKKIGYDAIQVSSIGPINPRDLKKMCDDIGLTICATHEPNEEIINNTEAVIEKLNTLNCTYTALPYPKNMNFLDLNVLDKFIEDIKIAGSKFHAEGKVLCYHNHALEFQKVQNELILDRIYENTDSKFIQGEPDIYWIQKGGQDPLMWCKKLEQRMPLLHLKDFIMINDQESFFAEVGLGNLDIKNIVKTATDSGCKWFIVEQDECSGDPFDSVEISYNNLRKYAVT